MTVRGTRLSGRGLSVTVPRGWDGQITGTLGRKPGEEGGPSAGDAGVAVLHVATFALPRLRGDYGGGAVESMRPDDVFVALIEFEEESTGTLLFSDRGINSISGYSFDRDTMHRTIPGQAGHQQFFRARGRAFCLYSAIGSYRNRQRLGGAVASVVATLRIDPR